MLKNDTFDKTNLKKKIARFSQRQHHLGLFCKQIWFQLVSIARAEPPTPGGKFDCDGGEIVSFARELCTNDPDESRAPVRILSISIPGSERCACVRRFDLYLVAICKSVCI